MRGQSFIVGAMLVSALSVQAEEISEGCGVSIEMPGPVAFRLVRISGGICESTIRYSAQGAPPVLQDESFIKVFRQPVVDLLRNSNYFAVKNGKYELKISRAVIDPQYQISSIKKRAGKLTGAGVHGAFGLEVLGISANPTMLWPSQQERRSGLRRFQRLGEIRVTCIYAQIGPADIALSATVSTCIANSNDPTDPSAKKLLKAIKDIRFKTAGH